jgi:hypothetical protein
MSRKGGRLTVWTQVDAGATVYVREPLVHGTFVVLCANARERQCRAVPAHFVPSIASGPDASGSVPFARGDVLVERLFIRSVIGCQRQRFALLFYSLGILPGLRIGQGERIEIDGIVLRRDRL